MKLTILPVVVVMLAVANPVPAVAAAYLCVEDAVTGFDWEGGRWVQKNFRPQQWLIRKHELDDPVSSACVYQMTEGGLNVEWKPGEAQTSVYACYTRTEVGEEVGYAGPCREWLSKSGEVTQIECEGFVSTYRFTSSGEYVSTTTFGAFGNASTEDQRDSLGLAVGRCSIVSN